MYTDGEFLDNAYEDSNALNPKRTLDHFVDNLRKHSRCRVNGEMR